MDDITKSLQDCQDIATDIDKGIANLQATNAALLEALVKLVDAKNNYAIVGRDDTGHALNEIGVARMNARKAIRKATE